MEYLVVSSGHPELYKEMIKIIDDWGVSHRIKVVKSPVFLTKEQKNIKK